MRLCAGIHVLTEGGVVLPAALDTGQGIVQHLVSVLLQRGVAVAAEDQRVEFIVQLGIAVLVDVELLMAARADQIYINRIVGAELMVFHGGQLAAEAIIADVVAVAVHQADPFIGCGALPFGEGGSEGVRHPAGQVLPDHPVVAVGHLVVVALQRVGEFLRGHGLAVGQLGLGDKGVLVQEQYLKDQDRQNVVFLVRGAQEGIELQRAGHTQALGGAGMGEVLHADGAGVAAQLEAIGIHHVDI